MNAVAVAAVLAGVSVGCAIGAYRARRYRRAAATLRAGAERFLPEDREARWQEYQAQSQLYREGF